MSIAHLFSCFDGGIYHCVAVKSGIPKKRRLFETNKWMLTPDEQTPSLGGLVPFLVADDRLLGATPLSVYQIIRGLSLSSSFWLHFPIIRCKHAFLEYIYIIYIYMYILNPLVNHHLHFVLPHMFGIYFSIYSEFSGHIPEILGNAGKSRPLALASSPETTCASIRRRGTHRLFALHLQWTWRGQRFALGEVTRHGWNGPTGYGDEVAEVKF